MNAGLLRKTLRDALPLLIPLTLAIILFEASYVLVVRDILMKMMSTAFIHFPFVREIVSTALGGDLGEEMTTTALMTIGFSHPLLFTFTCVWLITSATRGTVGEIDRGTADLLLGLPVSRTAVYTSSSLIVLLCAACASAGTLVGAWLGGIFVPLKDPLDLGRLGLVSANFFALSLAIGGITLLAAGLLSRRGPAIAVPLAVLLISTLFQVLAPFWSIARKADYLGLFHYFLPLRPVRTGQWPLRDMLILSAVGGVCWLIGLWYFRRRDIPAL